MAPYLAPAPRRRFFGGARRELTERATLTLEAGGTSASSLLGGPASIEGWTLNVSRGGLRVVVEASLQDGATYRVRLGEGEARSARVVWTQSEADGQIAGLEYTDVRSSSPEFDPGSGTFRRR